MKIHMDIPLQFFFFFFESLWSCSVLQRASACASVLVCPVSPHRILWTQTGDVSECCENGITGKLIRKQVWDLFGSGLGHKHVLECLLLLCRLTNCRSTTGALMNDNSNNRYSLKILHSWQTNKETCKPLYIKKFFGLFFNSIGQIDLNLKLKLLFAFTSVV